MVYKFRNVLCNNLKKYIIFLQVIIINYYRIFGIDNIQKVFLNKGKKKESNGSILFIIRWLGIVNQQYVNNCIVRIYRKKISYSIFLYIGDFYVYKIKIYSFYCK